MKQVTLINTIAVKPERMAEFIAAQRDFSNRMAGRATGLIGGRMYKSVAGDRVTLISQFESAEAQQRILASDAFKQHLAQLRDMVESSNPAQFEEAYTTGSFS